MNAFSTLALVYLLFTVISSSILYGAFRKKMDASALYFLSAELLMAIASGFLFLINLNLLKESHATYVVVNFASIGSEIAILFSILSMTKNIAKKYFLLAFSIVGALTAFLEIIRDDVSLKFLVLIYTSALCIIFCLNYLACKYKLSPSLAKNQFMILFRWLELSLVFYGILRVLAYFSSDPIIPKDTPSNLAIAIYTSYIVLSSFRYISYVGLRMNWVDPNNPSQNFLNQNLANAIREKDQLLRGLIASNRVIGISALASSLSHQLSQPLTTIALQADTARRDLIPTEQNFRLSASLDEISFQSKKLAELVKNLRQLFSSRSYEFHPINLQKITNEIIELIEPSLESKKITLHKNYKSNPVIFGDSIQMQQVLVNIFNNAIDALSQKNAINKKISVVITQDNKSAFLYIKDNGSGIDPELLPTIFELYKSTKQNGLGVGLWLSQVIIERHRGSINAFNSPSGGAVFEVKNPLHITQANLR